MKEEIQTDILCKVKIMIDNNLKFIREDMEMTQKELGYVFGVHESTVCGWETGSRKGVSIYISLHLRK